MTLLKECIDARGDNIIVLSKKETEEIFECMSKSFPITSWGQIEWSAMKHAKKISSAEELVQHLNNKEASLYILWDEASLPSIKTNLNKILAVIDDVTAVSFDTWLYSPAEGYVIEFYHENEITIGWVNL